jgi:hypothetical protein
MLNITERKWFKINTQVFPKNDKRNLLFVNIRSHENEKRTKLPNRIFQWIKKINSFEKNLKIIQRKKFSRNEKSSVHRT